LLERLAAQFVLLFEGELSALYRWGDARAHEIRAELQTLDGRDRALGPLGDLREDSPADTTCRLAFGEELPFHVEHGAQGAPALHVAQPLPQLRKRPPQTMVAQITFSQELTRFLHKIGHTALAPSRRRGRLYPTGGPP
jgi:hypothetical protein